MLLFFFALFGVALFPGIQGFQDIVLVLGGGEDQVFQGVVFVRLLVQVYGRVRVRSALRVASH